MGGEKPQLPVKPKKINIYRLIVITMITSFLAAVTYVVATAFMRSNPTFNPQRQLIEIHQTMTNPGQLAFGDRERILILCLGLDENRDEKGIGYTKGSRTDTIFILNLDKKGERMGILSIPRDTWIDLGEKYGNGKINSAYSEAFWEEYEKSGHDYEKAKMAGIMQARKVIQDFLGIDIDYYAMIKIKAAREIVDTVGGLTVDVEKDMDYDDNWGNLHVHLRKGRQRLDGASAVGYARFRHDEESDWGRIRRQQQVIQALVSELKKPIHIMHINGLARIVKTNLDTDLDLSQIIDIAQVYRKFSQKNIIKGVVSGGDDWAGGAMIIVPNEEETRRLVGRVLRSPSEILPEELRVRVFSRNAPPGTLQAVIDSLKADGYNVEAAGEFAEPEIEPAPSPTPDETESPAPEGTPSESPSPSVTPMEIPREPPYYGTEIIDHFGNPGVMFKLCRAMKFYKGRVTRKQDDNRDAPADFTLIVGSDYYVMPDDPRQPEDSSPPPIPTDDGPGTFKATTAPIEAN
jgi:LCP family protein required for cell wall assembly